MTRLFVAAIAALVVALNAIPAGAQLAGPKVALHITPHNTTKGANFCENSPADTALVPCSQYTMMGDVLTGYDLYIVVAQADTNGVAGLTFGVEYNNTSGAGVDVVGLWNLCSSGLEFPSTAWPESGEGNVLTWNTVIACGNTNIDPDGIHATAGGLYVYAYDPDRFVITQHKKLGQPTLATANCLGVESDMNPLNAGFVGFGLSGCNPCVSDGCTTPVEAATWGRIKSQY